MARPPRPTPPSAIDGYRRLERTRRVATPDASIVVTRADVAPRERGARPARLAGALRLAGFISVLAIIVGTSVSLASAGTRGAGKVESAERTVPTESVTVREAAATKPQLAGAKPELVGPKPKLVGPKAQPAPAETAVVTAVRPIDDAPVAGATDDPAEARAQPSARALPFTGALEVHRILLAGASLVLLGMLLQIAGQPLPARARM